MKSDAKDASGGATTVCILVTGTIAHALPAACCGVAGTDDLQRSPWILRARRTATRKDAGLTRLQWSCRGLRSSVASEELHSQWFDTNDLVVVERIEDAHASLGRGPHEQSFELENSNRVELWTNPALGRFTVATSDIQAGQCALKATAFAVVVKQQLVRKRCHWCFTTLRAKAFQCGGCKFALYCSHDCLDADEVLHGFQCRTLEQLGGNVQNGNSVNSAMLEQLESAWRESGIDVETIRLTLAVLSMEDFVRTTKPLSRLVTPRTTSQKQKGVLDQVAAFIVAGATTTGRSGPFATTLHVRETLQRVQCNAHPLCVNGRTTVGVGVFPEAAMTLNHSCLPNVVPSFDMRTRTLSFHAIQRIQQGHAVEYSYIDLFQAAKRRQEVLADGFGFDCTCWRCVDETKRVHSISPSDDACRDEQDAVVMKQLMQLRSIHPAQRDMLRQLFAAHRSVFERSHEIMFAYRMLLMKHAAARHDWKGVITEAETLIDMWKSEHLPEAYPTMETLCLQVQIAADKAGLPSKAARARHRVAEIRSVCGYANEE